MDLTQLRSYYTTALIVGVLITNVAYFVASSERNKRLAESPTDASSKPGATERIANRVMWATSALIVVLAAVYFFTSPSHGAR